MNTASCLLQTQKKFQRHRSQLSCEMLSDRLKMYIFRIFLVLIFVFLRNKTKITNSYFCRSYLRLYIEKTLLEKGKVVWGYLVQANAPLFKPGKKDGFAAIVYSLDPEFNNNLYELYRIATELYELKGETIEHPEVLDLKAIATAITNGDKLFNVKIPKSVALDKEVYFTTIQISRKHLPLNYLNSCWFPILVAPEETNIARILPSKYWCSYLLKAWCSNC